MRIEELEIDGKKHSVLSHNIFRKNDEFRAVLNVSTIKDKLPLDEVGHEVIAHGTYHGKKIRIFVQKAEVIQELDGETSICVFSDRYCESCMEVEKNCKNGTCNGTVKYLTVINEASDYEKVQLTDIGNTALTQKQRGRLDKILNEYRSISGNDMSIDNGHFVLNSNGKTIREPIALSRFNLKKKNLYETQMQLRRVFFGMYKEANAE